MTAEVVTHPAQNIAVATAETFDQFTNRIYRSSKRQLRYKDGEPVELNPEWEYSFLMLGMTRLATPPEFEVLYTRIMTSIAQAEAAGEIPAGLVQSVATPFDVTPPKIPAQYIEELEEGAEMKTYLVGEVGFAVTKKFPEPVVEEEETEE
jgi:hypothetical protein